MAAANKNPPSTRKSEITTLSDNPRFQRLGNEANVSCGLGSV